MKIIDKYLDKYFAIKLIEKIVDNITTEYIYDVAVVKRKDEYFVKIKPRRFNREMYRTVFAVNKINACVFISNYQEILSIVKEKIKQVKESGEWESI